MDSHYVNKNAQPKGEHEVHKSSCQKLPELQHRKYLGQFSTCEEAVREAKKTYPTADGCYYCIPTCHKR